MLVSMGYKEIVLTGIHVGGYGKDLNGHTFSDLVEALSSIDNLYRLRISSIEESEIDDKLIELIRTKSNIAKHLHIPLQSGSDSVLRRMNRKYSCKDFIAKLHKIRKIIPEIALTTDVIVGFPGETNEEFEETRQFIIDCGFNMLHVFPFSPREGTAAYLMKEQVHSDIKNSRCHNLLDLSKEIWEKYTKTFVDRELEVLIEQIDKNSNVCIGHTTNFLSISTPCNGQNPGDIIKIKIKSCDII
jgi:threonylcarbamoyladenosine tRNA methylthiotransferase MtaB